MMIRHRIILAVVCLAACGAIRAQAPATSPSRPAAAAGVRAKPAGPLSRRLARAETALVQMEARLETLTATVNNPPPASAPSPRELALETALREADAKLASRLDALAESGDKARLAAEARDTGATVGVALARIEARLATLETVTRAGVAVAAKPTATPASPSPAAQAATAAATVRKTPALPPDDPAKAWPLAGKPLSQTRFLADNGDVVDLKDFVGKKNVVLVMLRGNSGTICVNCSYQLV